MPRRTPDSWWSATVIAVLFGVIAAFLAWCILERSAWEEAEQREAETVSSAGAGRAAVDAQSDGG